MDRNSDYADFDSLDAAMGNDLDNDMSNFANTEFDNGGQIVSSAGYTPNTRNARSPSSRPKSVNWSDMPSAPADSLMVNDDEWGEWGSATPAERNTPAVRGGGSGGQMQHRQMQAAEQEPAPVSSSYGRYPAPAIGQGRGATPPANNDLQISGRDGGGRGGAGVAENMEPERADWAPRSILSRAVSRAVGNTLQNRRDGAHTLVGTKVAPLPGGTLQTRLGMAGSSAEREQPKQTVAFGRDGFSDTVAFGGIDVNAAEALNDQAYNSKYLEYKQQQMNKARQGPVGGSRHAITSTIVAPIEVMPPVLSSKLISQGILQHTVLNRGINLGDAVEKEAARRAKEDYKHALDMDKVAIIGDTRRPARRLDPALEKTGFPIGAQMVEPMSPEARRAQKEEWKAKLIEDEEKSRVGIHFGLSKKEFARRAFTPKHNYSRNQAQLEMDEKPHRVVAMERGAAKREELRCNRQDLLEKMRIGAGSTSLSDLRKARQHIGGLQEYFNGGKDDYNRKYDGYNIGHDPNEPRVPRTGRHGKLPNP